MTTVPEHLSNNSLTVFSGALALKVFLPTVCGTNPSLRSRSSTARTNASCFSVEVPPTLTKTFSSFTVLVPAREVHNVFELTGGADTPPSADAVDAASIGPPSLR